MYLLFTLVISILSQWNAVKFIHFLIGSLVTFSFFIAIDYIYRRIIFGKIYIKILGFIGILALLILISGSWTLAFLSGFNSSHCNNLVAKDFFIGKASVHCNVPPWHTKIIGGEEARIMLLQHCQANSPLLGVYPDYCDVYKNPHIDNDWTVGPNR